MQNHVDLDLAQRDASGDATGYSWYDELGRPERWAWGDTLHVNPSGAATMKIGFEYGYDRAGNKTKQDSLHDPKDNQTYRYDSTGRLVGYDRGDSQGQTWANMASARDWDLDGLGNWDWVDTNVGGTTVTENRSHTTFNEIANWNDGASSGTLGHDDNGNLLEKEDFTLTWDDFNRLSMADELDVNPSGTAIRYAYDTGNRRVAKATLDVSASSTLNDLYLYGGWQVLEERRTPSLQTNPSTTLHRQFVYGNYIDEPLVMDTNQDSDGDCLGTQDSRLFYHTNTLFSVYALTDEGGNIVEAYAYDPYGKHVVIKDGDSDGVVEFDSTDDRTAMGVGNFDNPYTFTGRRYDADTGLHYYRNRYYDAILGRFVSRDPIGYEDGRNLYSGYFVMRSNNDPYGLRVVEVGDWEDFSVAMATGHGNVRYSRKAIENLWMLTSAQSIANGTVYAGQWLIQGTAKALLIAEIGHVAFLEWDPLIETAIRYINDPDNWKQHSVGVYIYIRARRKVVHEKYDWIEWIADAFNVFGASSWDNIENTTTVQNKF